MKAEMFALSFTALFLEMMVIRWVPSVVHLVAYYANLMLLSSFLGLGAGAQQPVDRAFEPGEPGDPPVVDRSKVGAEEAPADRQDSQ